MESESEWLGVQAVLDAEKLSRSLSAYVIQTQRLVAQKQSSRSNFMHTLEAAPAFSLYVLDAMLWAQEIIGACPDIKERSFRDDWVELNVDSHCP